MLLPVIPSFSPGESSITHLQQLSNAVQYATVAQYLPMWRLYKAATQGITAGSWNTMSFGTIAIDTDNVFNYQNGVTLNTQGYYSTEACIPFVGAASAGDLQMTFLWTAGPNNVNYSSGTTVRYGGHASSASGQPTLDFVLNMADVCPVVCYPGDTIVIQVWVTVATSTDTLTNTSATAGWFPPQFSGRWIRTGA